MDGAQDMGGVEGFGPVRPEIDEPVFHAAWERRAFAVTLAMVRPGGWTIDTARFARENRPPADYLSKSYYEIWLAGLEQLMAERSLLTAEEIAAGRPLLPRRDVPTLPAEGVADMLRRGGPSQRAENAPALFAIGDRVRAKDIHPPGHTRLPRYVRGHTGIVTLIHGCHVFPDTNAHGLGELPQWLYTVAFDGRELWGAESSAGVTISVDAWQPYLEPAA